MNSKRNTTDNTECVVPAEIRCKETKCRDKYVWTIRNFLKHSGELLDSPEFPSGNNSFCWSLQLYTGRRGNEPDADNNLKITFKRSEDSFVKYGPVSGFVVVELRKAGSSWREVADFDFTQADSSVKMDQFYMRKLLDHALLGAGVLINGDLVLHCEVTYTRFVPIEIPDSDATEDFEKYFNNEESSDVAVYVGDKKFPAHTFVLAAHSPVFEAMFKKGKKRKTRQNRIDVKDIDEKTFERLISYMYTGKIDDLDNAEWKVENSQLEVESLFVAADQYGMEKLKVRCEIEFSRLLSVKTAVRILLFADTHDLVALKKWTIDFINGHLTGVKYCSDRWKDLCSRQNLLLEVLHTKSPETGYTDDDRAEYLNRCNSESENDGSESD